MARQPRRLNDIGRGSGAAAFSGRGSGRDHIRRPSGGGGKYRSKQNDNYMGKWRGGAAGEAAARRDGEGGGGGRYGGADRFSKHAKDSGDTPAPAADEQPKGPASDARTEEDLQVERDMGYELYDEGDDGLGWLMNMNATTMTDVSSGREVAAVACYFMRQNGSTFKADVPFTPYFYVVTKPGHEAEVENYLRRKHEGRIKDVDAQVEKEDLDLKVRALRFGKEARMPRAPGAAPALPRARAPRATKAPRRACEPLADSRARAAHHPAESPERYQTPSAEAVVLHDGRSQ